MFKRGGRILEWRPPPIKRTSRYQQRRPKARRGRKRMQSNQVTRRIRPMGAAVGKLRLLVLPLAVVAFLVFASTPAFAAKTHQLVKTFSHAAAPGHGLGSYLSLGVDESAENLFVGSSPENGKYRIDITGPEGEEPSGLASPFSIDVTAKSSTNQSHEGIAVDNSPTSPSKGSLYVADTGSHEVKKYTLNPLSEEYEQTGTLSASRPLDVAVDTKGNVFVADEESKSIAKFSPTGSPLGQIPVGFPAKGVAVDGKGDLYVQEAAQSESSLGRVIELPANGSGEIEPGTQPIEIASGDGTSFHDNPAGIAADQSANELYVVYRDRVEQFDPSGNRVGEFELFTLTPRIDGRLIAVNGQSGLVYVFGALSGAGGESPGIGVFGPTVITPDATTEAVSNLTVDSATLNGTVSAAGALPATCEFEYADEASFKAEGFKGAATAPCSPAGPFTGSSVQPVSAAIGGLATQTFYRYRLVASSANGITRGKTLKFVTPGPPIVDGESVSELTGTSATLEAFVNPSSEATSYVFEYITEADFKASGYAKATSLPPGGEAIGSGFEAVAVSQPIAGLTPSTNYVFRVVATNPLGTKSGPDQLFTTLGFNGFELPDGRFFEQVTPVDKNGAAPKVTPSFTQAAYGGDAIAYGSGGGIPGGEGAQQYPNYLASRGPDWSTQGILPAASNGSSAAVLGWSEDLSQTYAVQGAQPLAPLNFLQRDSSTQLTRTIVSEASNDLERGYSYVGASADGSLVVFESPTELLEGASTKGPNIYAWDRDSGELSLAGVLNTGSAPPKGATSALDNRFTQAQRTVSSDGSRVFFTDAGLGQLYMRQNPTQPQSAHPGEHCSEPALACTVSISASQRTVADPKSKKPLFWGASADGSAAFFTSAAKLTDNATTGPDDEGNDLYRYDAETGVLSDLTPDSEAGDPNGAEVRGVLGTSDDGTYVYFAANGVLAPGASHGNCSESGGGSCNLYLAHDGTIDFVSAIDGSGGNWLLWPSGENTARVSADGQALLFASKLKLDEYDNKGIREFYRYGVADEEVTCVSCNPTGAAPVGESTLQSDASVLQTRPSPAATVSRNLSADGKRFFFETPDKLVASDTNGDGGCPFLNGTVRLCQDVYEWEANGSGSCESELQNGGCLYLISSGTSVEPSYFADASADGEDVFFLTVEPLVGQDTDQIADIYDARVDGGIASQNPPPPPPLCEGEACKGPVPVAPVSESAGSASFSGPAGQKPSRHKKKQHKKKKQKKQHKKSHATRKHR